MSNNNPDQKLAKLRREAKAALNSYAEGYGSLNQALAANWRLKMYLDLHPEANREAPRA